MEYINLIKDKFLELPKKYKIAIGVGVIVILALIFG